MRGYDPRQSVQWPDMPRIARDGRLALVGLVVLLLAWRIAAGGAAMGQSGREYTLTRSVVSGGASSLTGGAYVLAGMAGEPHASALTGGAYTLGGGFWGSAEVARIYLPLVVRSVT